MLSDNVNVPDSPHLISGRADDKDVSANEKLPQGDWFALFRNTILSVLSDYK